MEIKDKRKLEIIEAALEQYIDHGYASFTSGGEELAKELLLLTKTQLGRNNK